MKKIYHYIFYKFYKYLLTTPNADSALNGATIYLCMTILFYLLTIDILLKKVFRLYTLSNNLFMVLGVLVSIVSFYGNYIYFKNNKLYLKIDDRFSKEDKRQKFLGNIFVFLLFIGSFISFMLIGYFINKNL